MGAKRQDWPLSKDVAYLNHGALGIVPNPVGKRRRELLEQLESQPKRFFRKRVSAGLGEFRKALADLIDADRDGLCPVRNATTGLNAVLASIQLEQGDEVIVTDHGYGGCNSAVRRYVQDAGAKLRVVEIGRHVQQPDRIERRVCEAVSSATRLVVLDHVTSSTAVVLPIEKILTALEDKDVAVCVDGAQAPGMFELSLRELQPDFYLGDCHKWLSGPRGSGFVWVDEPHRSTFRPAIFGSGELGRQQLHHRFRANGTRDWTPFLCVPTAIEWLGQRRPGGWSDVYRENAATVGKAVARIGEQLGYEPVFFEEGRQSMAAFPLQAASVDGDYKALEKRLFEKHRVELAFKRHEAFGVIFRVSCHLYNDESDIEKGINALQTELT